MAATWIKGYSPELLTQRLEEAKTVDAKGKVSFQGFEFKSNIVVLNSMVSCNSDIPEPEKKRIISNAAFHVASMGKITPQSLLSGINKFEKQYLTARSKKYILLTKLSISNRCRLKRHSLNGCIITFHQHFNQNFIKEREKLIKHASYSIQGALPTDYQFTKISVQGKSLSEAADKAIDTIDLLRGIWNLYNNRKHSWRISSGTRKPVNKFALGPLHTLHLQNGKLATESWWYEPDYRGPLESYDISKNIEELNQFECNVRKLLNKSPFKPFLESAIIRYTRALDLRDWESAFLRLWGLLESLTNTGENDTHKVTVKRTSFMYADREYIKQILTHLRDYRNRAVHSGSGNQDIETFLYQLKNFVESALEFLVANKFDLKNLNEVAQFLDLPDDIETLSKRIRLIKNALKYIEK